jgi:hypothetical protein
MHCLVYVLAHSEETLQRAQREYGSSSCFKPILMPQTAWMESVMYTDYLLEHEDEWRDCDYVGCISYAASSKQPLIHKIDELFEIASKEGVDALAFLYKGDPLTATATKWHTQAWRDAWVAAWTAVGYPNQGNRLFDDSSFRSFYSNYWACRPVLMREYCQLLQQLRQRMDGDSSLKALLWADSTYQDRGADIAKMTVDTRMRLFGVPYYPMLGFVCERMPCAWFSAFHPLAPIKMLMI